jgi:hypothetical protein
MLSFGRKRSFPSSFAYETGPAYGLLLNVIQAVKFDKITWRTGLTHSSSISDMVASLIDYKIPPDLGSAAIARAKQYGYDELSASETKREDERKAKEAAYRSSLVEGPVLVLPLKNMNFSYDPDSVFPLGSHGTVYSGSTVSDAWGKIVAPKGVLISPDFTRATVMAPETAKSDGEGWKLTLAPGWKIVPGPRKGDFTVSQ